MIALDDSLFFVLSKQVQVINAVDQEPCKLALESWLCFTTTDTLHFSQCQILLLGHAFEQSGFIHTWLKVMCVKPSAPDVDPWFLGLDCYGWKCSVRRLH